MDSWRAEYALIEGLRQSAPQSHMLPSPMRPKKSVTLGDDGLSDRFIDFHGNASLAAGHMRTRSVAGLRSTVASDRTASRASPHADRPSGRLRSARPPSGGSVADHRLGLEEFVQTPLAKLASVAGLLVAADWRRDVPSRVVEVDIPRPGCEATRRARSRSA